MYVRSKIPLQILQDSYSKSCKTLVWFLHARLCTVHILHGSKTCKKSCKDRLARLLQGLIRLWPLLLQYVRFLSKYIRFSCKMCQILMQASLQASCKSLMYGGGGVGSEASLPVCKCIKLVNYSETLITAWFYDTVVALY